MAYWKSLLFIFRIFFERNRASYYDALMAVRLRHDLLHWILFFLNGVEETAKKGCLVFRQILKLQQELQGIAMGMGKRAELAGAFLKILYSNPVQTPKSVQQLLDISPATANSLLKDFENSGILQEITGGKRDRVYAMSRYIDIF
ncbi:hypothetical protein LP090_12785 [Moraxella bovis]|uniref:hypothetical protein n=1 Tax=Moraxella bovis TaxID=476 RepID=UPI002227561B|nr:hypothetical protein [Moraxella bovis]UZA43003.1 hypothetical protein LP090_12785 [Moraxella bovis]